MHLDDSVEEEIDELQDILEQDAAQEEEDRELRRYFANRAKGKGEHKGK